MDSSIVRDLQEVEWSTLPYGPLERTLLKLPVGTLDSAALVCKHFLHCIKEASEKKSPRIVWGGEQSETLRSISDLRKGLVEYFSQFIYVEEKWDDVQKREVKQCVGKPADTSRVVTRHATQLVQLEGVGDGSFRIDFGLCTVPIIIDAKKKCSGSIAVQLQGYECFKKLFIDMLQLKKRVGRLGEPCTIAFLQVFTNERDSFSPQKSLSGQLSDLCCMFVNKGGLLDVQRYMFERAIGGIGTPFAQDMGLFERMQDKLDYCQPKGILSDKTIAALKADVCNVRSNEIQYSGVYLFPFVVINSLHKVNPNSLCADLLERELEGRTGFSLIKQQSGFREVYPPYSIEYALTIYPLSRLTPECGKCDSLLVDEKRIDDPYRGPMLVGTRITCEQRELGLFVPVLLNDLQRLLEKPEGVFSSAYLASSQSFKDSLSLMAELLEHRPVYYGKYGVSLLMIGARMKKEVDDHGKSKNVVESVNFFGEIDKLFKDEILPEAFEWYYCNAKVVEAIETFFKRGHELPELKEKVVSVLSDHKDYLLGEACCYKQKDLIEDLYFRDDVDLEEDL